MNKQKTYETYLPSFPGFYNSALEPRLEDEIDYFYVNGFKISKVKTLFIKNRDDLSNLIYDNFDYKDYEKYVAKLSCKILEDEIDVISKIKFQKLVSPRQYNYATDSVDCEITINTDKLEYFIFNNQKYVGNYLKNHYQSKSGFISHYPNNLEGWRNETNNFKNLSGHYLGSLLTCYMEFHNISNLLYPDELEFNLSEYIDVETILEDIKDIEHSFKLDN